MKKNILNGALISLILLLFTSNPVFSQNEEWFFSISMGSSMPQGSFSSKKIGQQDAGFAKNGFSLQLDASYPITSHLSARGLVALNSQPIDRNGFGGTMEERMVKQVPFTESERDYLTLTIDPWMWNSMLAGPSYTIQLGSFYWDLQALAGLSAIYHPKQKLKFANPETNWEYFQKGTNSTGFNFGWMVGTSGRFDISEKTGLRLSVDYFSTSTSLDYEEIKITRGANNSYEIKKLASGSTKHPIGTLTLSAGFVYYL